MAKIKIKRERVKFASDNVAGACPEVLDAILKANEGDSTPYGNDPISKGVLSPSLAFKIASNTSGQAPATLSEANLTRSLFILIFAIIIVLESNL